MTPEIGSAFQRLREKFGARLMATALTPNTRTQALRAFDQAVQEYDKPPATAQPKDASFWDGEYGG